MNRLNRLVVFAGTVVLATACSSCATREPLPGDSVSNDGAVSLATPPLTTVGASAGTIPTNGSAHGAAHPSNAIESRLFSPELVMEHQATIGLTPAQRDAMTEELDKTQAELVRLQWQLEAEKSKLIAVLDGSKIDEGRSKQSASALMDRENAIKAAHLTLLVRIKNLLTPAQQDKLRRTRDADRCGAATSKDGASAAPDAGRD